MFLDLALILFFLCLLFSVTLCTIQCRRLVKQLKSLNKQLLLLDRKLPPHE